MDGRQRELCLLSSFISDQEEWLNSVLSQLKWSRESIQCERDLVKCPYNEHHYVPSELLEAHKTSCYLASKGANPDTLDGNDPLVIPINKLYQDSCIPLIEIDGAIERAVTKCASDPNLYREKEPIVWTPQPRVDSVEDSVDSGLDKRSLQPHQVISFIKGWKKVPLDWTAITLSPQDLGHLKGWLFQNLPNQHAHSSSVGGEIVAVDTILHLLTQQTSVTPNTIVDRLKPLLKSNAAQFVLSLWKQLSISTVQLQHGIPENVVEDIAPMPLTQLLALQRGAADIKQEKAPLVYNTIKELTSRERPPSPKTPPLPMSAVFFSHTPAERRVAYDYVVEAGRVKRPKEKKIDPDLFRDDEAALKAKLKALSQQEGLLGDQEAKSYQDLLEERKKKRDYKRRRQKYRAKNAHITRRKTSEIFRDIIDNRMEEIANSLGPPVSPVNTPETTDPSKHQSQLDCGSHSEIAHSDKRSSLNRKDDLRDNHKKRHSSRSKSRSRSRERHHSHKKHKKHKSHKHSHSSSSRHHRD